MVVVQLAHALGGHVTALASARDADFVARCGADEVLDYRTAAARGLGPFDVIIDTAGPGMLAFQRRLARGGRMITINFGSGPALAAIGVSTVFGARRIRTFAGYPDTPLLEQTAEHVRSGAMNPAVGNVYPLADIVDAHHALAASHSPGKLVLDLTR